MKIKMRENNTLNIKYLGTKFIRSLKSWIKKNRCAKNPLIRLGIGGLYLVLITLNNIKFFFKDKEFRTIFYMKLFKSKRLQQTTPLTYMNRYPIIFSACADYFKEKEDIKILSYGCSTGEEVLTLRKYFPKATIVGAEINKHSLETCRKLPVDDKITFIYSTPSEIQKHGNFDIVFCMAVLQRTPHQITEQGITSLKKIYPFEKFEHQIIELDEYVKPGGLLVVHFTQYSFIDTVVSPKYKALGDYNQDDYKSSVFDKNSNLIKNPTSQKSIFIKQQA